MDTTTNAGGENLLKTEVTRRGTLTAAAWAAPVIAVAAATPAAVASPLDPTSDLSVAALGGAEGRYQTGSNYSAGGVSSTDFRRAFSVTNNGAGSFTGSLRIDFRFPGMWNQAGGVDDNTDAFNNWGTVDLGGTNGGSIGGKSAWTTSDGTWSQNTGTYAWTAVHLRNDNASVTLTNVSLPPGATIWFALNASVPFAWIGNPGVYINPGNPNRIYWRSPVSITAFTTGGTNLGTYVTEIGALPGDGIWYFNGGGPFAYNGGHGLYPSYGSS